MVGRLNNICKFMKVNEKLVSNLIQGYFKVIDRE